MHSFPFNSSNFLSKTLAAAIKVLDWGWSFSAGLSSFSKNSSRYLELAGFDETISLVGKSSPRGFLIIFCSKPFAPVIYVS